MITPRFHGAVLVVVWTLALAACGEKSSTSQISTDPADERPLFVVMGGYNSCGDANKYINPSPYTMDLYLPFWEMKEALFNERGIDARYILSCFTEANQNINYVDYTNPDVVVTEPLAAFTDLVTAAAGKEAGNTYLIGHSHGGWLAMHLAATLADSVQIKHIETIDPISYVECTRDTIVDWGSGPNPVCLRAPADIDGPAREQIADRSGRWLNSYQTQSVFLHSTAIPEADENVRLRMTVDMPFGMDAHSDMDNDSRIWTKISAAVFTDFAPL